MVTSYFCGVPQVSQIGLSINVSRAHSSPEIPGDLSPRVFDAIERCGQIASESADALRFALKMKCAICRPMSPASPPLVFDRLRLRKRRARAASGFSEFDFLKTRIADEMMDRLADSPRNFPLALDLSSHTGQVARALKASGRVGLTLAADLSEAMLRGDAPSVCCDEERLPFKADTFDLVTSGLGLHMVNDLPGALIQIRNVLKPDGLFLGALFGAGTLTELRQSFLEAETALTGGASPRVSPLPGLQDMAGLLQRAGFALPVADIEPVTVRYETVFHLMADLKGMGERSVLAAGSGGLSRRILMRMAEIYAQRFADLDGRLRASFEIIWLSGWAPAPHQPKPLKPGSGKVSLADAVKGAGRDKKQS